MQPFSFVRSAHFLSKPPIQKMTNFSIPLVQMKKKYIIGMYSFVSRLFFSNGAAQTD